MLTFTLGESQLLITQVDDVVFAAAADAIQTAIQRKRIFFFPLGLADQVLELNFKKKYYIKTKKEILLDILFF